jgi:uncharacterized protein YjbI with pentapeptide repeats
LSGCTFDDCDLSKCNFTDAKFEKIEFLHGVVMRFVEKNVFRFVSFVHKKKMCQNVRFSVFNNTIMNKIKANADNDFDYTTMKNVKVSE